MRRFWPWMFRESDGSPSSRRVLFAAVVVFSLGIAAGAFWTTRSLSREAVDLLQAALLATGGAATVGRFAEKKGGSDVG